MNPHPIGCFARLAYARARRRPAIELQHQLPRRSVLIPGGSRRVNPLTEVGAQLGCASCCAHVSKQVWDALECVYPVSPIEGRGHRQALAALFAPLMARDGWRFCKCYLGPLPEHRFIQRLVDTGAANLAADACLQAVRCE